MVEVTVQVQEKTYVPAQTVREKGQNPFFCLLFCSGPKQLNIPTNIVKDSLCSLIQI